MREPAEKLLGSVRDTAFGLDASSSGGSGWGRTCFHSSSFTYTSAHQMFVCWSVDGQSSGWKCDSSLGSVPTLTYCDPCKWPNILPQFLCLLNSRYKILVPGYVVRTQWVDVSECLNSAWTQWVFKSLALFLITQATFLSLECRNRRGGWSWAWGGGSGLAVGGSQQRRGEWRDRKELRRREWDPEPSEPLIGGRREGGRGEGRMMGADWGTGPGLVVGPEVVVSSLWEWTVRGERGSGLEVQGEEESFNSHDGKEADEKNLRNCQVICTWPSNPVLMIFVNLSRKLLFLYFTIVWIRVLFIFHLNYSTSFLTCLLISALFASVSNPLPYYYQDKFF